MTQEQEEAITATGAKHLTAQAENNEARKAASSPPRTVKTAAIYGRVSTEHQDYAYQMEALREDAASRGWETVEYLEKESAKTGSNRPVLKKLIEDAALKRFEVVLVWKIDRFGRSLREFIQNLRTLDGLGIRFVAICEVIDTDQRYPFAKILMKLLARFAEFELDIIRERTSFGLQAYRRDYALGKVGEGQTRRSKSRRDLPVGRPRKIFPRERARELRSQGLSYRAIGKQLKVPFSTVRKAILELAA